MTFVVKVINFFFDIRGIIMEQKEVKTRRHRGSNFSKDEELLLLSEVEKFKTIIECKTTDKMNLSEKV